MKSFTIFVVALIALASASDDSHGASETSVYVGPHGVYGSNLVIDKGVLKGVSPVIASLSSPFYRTVNGYPYGTLVDYNGAYGYVAPGFSPVVTGVQGPSTRTVAVGADGSVIDSSTIGGVQTESGSVVVAPSIISPYVRSVNHVLPYTVVPSTIPGTRSVVYNPGYYSGYDYVHVPYGKSVVAGASGTIVAK